MALIRRLSMRRQIRRTAEQSLAQNPIFTGQPPATPLYHSAPPEVNVARLTAENADPPAAPAEASAPEGATTVEGSPPPVQVAPAPPSSTSSQVYSGEARPAVTRAPSPPIQPPPPDGHQEEWQLPQWQYTSKRARTNQHQQRKKGR